MSATFAAVTPHPSLRGVVLRYEGYAAWTAYPHGNVWCFGTYRPSLG